MISLEDVQIKYGDFTALDHVNLEINKGDFFTFLGPSGSGKSTMLRAIVGFIQHSSGDIKISGQVVNDLPVEKRGIGMIFQNYALFPTMTAYENIAFGLKTEKASKTVIERKVQEMAEMVDLNQQQLQKNVSELSGGQQQRVAITRSLAKEPQVLAMDEPLSNLDAKLRKSLRHEIKSIQAKTGLTTLYVTHDQEEALTLSDQIAIFNNRGVEQVGTPYDVYYNPATEFVCTFIGDSNKLTKRLVAQISPDIASQYDSFYVRTERIQILDANAEHGFSAELRHIDFYGKYIDYIFYSEEYDLELVVYQKVSSEKPMEEGTQVKLYIDPKHIMKFKGD
ncbi:ABC transporter ATP-binding protein [Alloiococcus otitis]|nr:ABC transporter ATP-binding protein [Alloiococcus otitis]